MNEFYRKHYTIIEMIVVIGILAVLVAMGAPAAISMISKKETTRAKQEIQAIKQAVKAYEAEYGKLPLSGNSFERLDDTTDPTAQRFISALLYHGNDKVTDNPRGIKFLAWVNNHGADTATTPDNWLDPWGQPYILAVDYDYNGETTIGDGVIVKGSFFIVSRGEDAADASDNIYSYK